MAGKPILIVDGHLDMAYNATYQRRDLKQTVQTLREREDGVATGLSRHPDSLERRKGPEVTPPGIITVTLPEMRRGRVGIMVSTIMARVQAPSGRTHNAVRTQVAAHAVGKSHLAYYRALEREGEIFWIRNARDLDACVAMWENPTPETPVGLILSAESADPILGPDNVQEWWDAGLRSVSLTHFGINTYGHGTGTAGGLYPTAYPLMDAMKAAGMILDITHASELSFWELLEYWDGPVHASHCACRALVPGHRHLSDEQIRVLIQRGGVIGLVFAEHMLNPGRDWDNPATHMPTATRPMAAVLEHLDHICQIGGNADHVAFGTDLDGGFGRELAPVDYDTIADLQKFLDTMRKRGYPEEDVVKFAHGNLLGFLRKAWK